MTQDKVPHDGWPSGSAGIAASVSMLCQERFGFQMAHHRRIAVRSAAGQ
jgi:hypothetical protein